MKDKAKIVIGPFILQKTGFGGVQNHILNIIKYSKYQLIPIPFFPSHFQFILPSFSHLSINDISPLTMYNLFHSKVIFSNYNIIHLHGHPYWSELFIKIKDSKTRYIHSIHAIYTQEDYPDDWEFRQKVNKKMINSCKESDFVIAVANWLKKRLEEEDVEAIYIPNGTNVNEFKNADANHFKKKFKLFDDFYLFVARLDEYKRPKMFIELAERIKDKKFILLSIAQLNQSLQLFMI